MGSPIRTTSAIVLVTFIVVLVMHLGGVATVASNANACHTAEGVPTSCVVSDVLQETLASFLVSFGIAVLAVVIARRVRDLTRSHAAAVVRATAVRPLALASPIQRALWRGTLQRRDVGDSCRYSVPAGVIHS